MVTKNRSVLSSQASLTLGALCSGCLRARSAPPLLATLRSVPELANPSCPLQALDSEGQQEPDDLQLETSRRDCVDLPGKQVRQLAEDRLDVLANRLAQELLPSRHLPLGVLLALGFQAQPDLLEEILVIVVGQDDGAFRQVQIQALEHRDVRFRARRQREPHRLACPRDHQMHPHKP